MYPVTQNAGGKTQIAENYMDRIEYNVNIDSVYTI